MTAPPAAPPRPPAPTKPRLARFVAITAGIIVIGWALLVWTVNGGPDTVRSWFGPHENSPDVIAARDAAWQAEADAVDAALTGPMADPDVLARTKDSSYNRGRHDWTYSDTYDLTCTSHTTVIVAGGTLETFRDDMVQLDDAFLASRWTYGTAGNMSMLSVLQGYWDDRANILGPEPRYFDYPSDMPGVGYDIPDTHTSVGISWLQSKPVFPDDSRPAEDTVWVTPDGRELTNEDMWTLVPEGQYAIAVGASTLYYQD